MYEITIRNLETNEVVDTAQNEMVLAIAYSDDDEREDSVALYGSIDPLSYAMLYNGHVRAACRLAIAKWEAKEDIEKEKMRQMKGEIGKMLEGLGEKMGVNVKAVCAADLVGEE